MLHYNILTIS